MRRVTLMLAAVAMMVSLFAVVAYAAENIGTNNSEELLESNRGDTIKALKGDDRVNAAVYQVGSPQTPPIPANGDRDRVHGNAGDDNPLNVQDKDGKDIVWGGTGIDHCLVDNADVGDGGDKHFGCEFVNGVPQ
jgi:predicted lipoprotein with Yx(FWY)xxD motif